MAEFSRTSSQGLDAVLLPMGAVVYPMEGRLEGPKCGSHTGADPWLRRHSSACSSASWDAISSNERQASKLLLQEQTSLHLGGF